MNQIEAIKDAGARAATARRRGDEATARFHQSWADKAIRLEDDPKAAREAYNKAYRDAGNPFGLGR